MENTIEKEKPYDHSKSSLVEACGFTDEEITDLELRSNKAVNTEGGLSNKVEAMEKALTPRELAYTVLQLVLTLKRE